MTLNVIGTGFGRTGTLLTLRTAESWWKSFEATILQHIQSQEHPDGFAQRLIAALQNRARDIGELQ